MGENARIYSDRKLTPHAPVLDENLLNEKNLLNEVVPGSADRLAQRLIMTIKGLGGKKISFIEQAEASGGYVVDSFTNGGSTDLFSFSKVASGSKIKRIFGKADFLGEHTDKEKVSKLALINQMEEESDISIATYGDVSNQQGIWLALKEKGNLPGTWHIEIPDNLSLSEKKQFVSHEVFKMSLIHFGQEVEEQFNPRVFDKQYLEERQELLHSIAEKLQGNDWKIALAESMTGGHGTATLLDALAGYDDLSNVVVDFANIVYSEKAKKSHHATPFALTNNNTYSLEAASALAESAYDENFYDQEGMGSDKTVVFIGTIGIANTPDNRPGYENHQRGEYYYTINTPRGGTSSQYVLLPVPESSVDPIQARLMMKELATIIFLQKLLGQIS